MSIRRIGRRRGFAEIPATAVQAALVAALCCILVAVTGCDSGRRPGTARLEGSITIDGQPPPAGAIGSISFRPTGKGQPTSAQIVNGKYKCDDVPVGDVVVFFQLVQETGRMVSEGGRSYPELRNLVSSKHDNGMNLNVSDDNSSQDFELVGNTSPQ